MLDNEDDVESEDCPTEVASVEFNLPKIEVIIEVIPITIPAITGVKNFIWDLMEEIMSAIKSFNLSFTLWISFI